MKRYSYLGLILLAGLVFLFFNNLFIGFTGKSIADLILSDNLDVADKEFSPPTDGGLGRECVDSDNGKNFFVFGSIKGYDNHGDFYALNDSCDGNNLTEYFCKNFSIMYTLYNCENGCENGACNSNETNFTNENLFCEDTDNGLNYFVKGNCRDFTENLEDACVIGGSKGWFLKEAYCKNKTCAFLNYDCVNGCSEGRCLNQGEASDENVFFSPEDLKNSPEMKCLDSDKGDLYKKGSVREAIVLGGKIFEDECLLIMAGVDPIKVKNCQGIECFLKEASCKEDGGSLIENFNCIQGCVDGACIKDLNFFEKITNFFKSLF
jgi:hypothetical protein